MADSTIKSYLKRNLTNVLKKQNASLGKLASVDTVAMANLATDLQNVINGKADAATTLAGYGITDGMTSTEVSEAIAAAIAAADHLKRKIVTGTDAIDLTAKDASQYIYMVPKATEADEDKYDEYMVIAGDEANQLEKVGDWKVDLDDYVKTAAMTKAISDALASYSTTTQMNEAITAATAGFIKLDSISAETTGEGNVVTAVSYDSATGKFTATKGDTAVMNSDLVDFTDTECDEIIAAAKATTTTAE